MTFPEPLMTTNQDGRSGVNTARRQDLLESQLAALFEVSSVLSRSLNLSETLREVLEVLHRRGRLCKGMVRLVDEQTTIDPVWGATQRIVLAWAADPQVRFRASTGGVLTALGLYLIESGEVELILQATASVSHPAFGESLVSTSSEDVHRAAGSRYGPTAVLSRAREALDRGRPMAFVGKPCDIAALRNYAEFDERVRKEEDLSYGTQPI